MAMFTPKNSFDYGILYCTAENKIGHQKEPCSYFIVPAGPPEPPENCSITNMTIHSLTVECLPGYNGNISKANSLSVYNLKFLF